MGPADLQGEAGVGLWWVSPPEPGSRHSPRHQGPGRGAALGIPAAKPLCPGGLCAWRPRPGLALSASAAPGGPCSHTSPFRLVSAAGPVSEGDCWGWMRGRLPREARQVPGRGCWDQAVVGAAGESECCRSWVGRAWRRRQWTLGLCTTGGSRGPAVRLLRGVVRTSKGRQWHLQGHGLCGWEAQASSVWRPCSRGLLRRVCEPGGMRG